MVRECGCGKRRKKRNWRGNRWRNKKEGDKSSRNGKKGGEDGGIVKIYEVGER